ncbi:M48 family metalloprotease [Kribbella sp. NPDC048915]|uniref:M48 family metalloprotease n=1 Tax=Kribbella sp. NPDC048915 TaxID=3155148 RepID=UPI0033F15041
MSDPDDRDRPGSFSPDDWESAAQPRQGDPAPNAPDGLPGTFGTGDSASVGGSPPPAFAFSTHSAAELLLGIPWAIWSFAVVSTVASWIVDGFAVVLIVTLWVLSGLLVVVPSTEEYVARYLYRLRLPTLLEQQKLDVAWRAVCTRAGVDPRYHKLWVEESETVNGASVAGRSVAVTRWALNNLPPRQLQAVLAHELGHHSGGHPWATLVVSWYAQPARLMVAAFRALLRLSSQVAAVGCLVVAIVVLAICGFAIQSLWGGSGSDWGWMLYAILPFVVPIPLAWLSRRSELVADRVAADLGYARELIAFFYDLQAQGEDVARRATGWRGALYATHPSIADRIRTLEIYLQDTRS